MEDVCDGDLFRLPKAAFGERAGQPCRRRKVRFVAIPKDRQGQRAAARPDPEQGLVVRLHISAKKRFLNVL